jgi:cytochrome d ubiquinol oxidase subunit II
MRAIGPHWDGNEVWLVTGGGAMFAAFPKVYATVFSGFYLAMILVIVALGLRAVSFEFRSKGEGEGWRGLWDAGFAVGSILATLLFGVALGNIMRGIPLDAEQYYAGTFLGLLNPYSLLIGVLGVAMVAFHGALFIVLKTSGELMSAARGWASKAGWVYLILFLVAVAVSMVSQGHLLENYNRIPILWIVPVLPLVMILGALIYHRREHPGRAFVASSLSILGLMSMAAVGLFPRLVPALGAPELSLTASNASSSALTLQTMLVIALIGMPLVIGYTIWVYRAFGGKVDLEAESGGY